MLQRPVVVTYTVYIVLCRVPLRESYLLNSSEIQTFFPALTLNVPYKSCTNPESSQVHKYRAIAKMSSGLPFFGQHDEQRTSLQGRSYQNGYGVPATANYYPTFDPISVLASLAFLAFLLQTFASLFDRSRSLIPTIVSSRQASPEFQMSGITARLLTVLDEYDNLKENLVQNTQ